MRKIAELKLGEIDKSIKVVKPQIFICKPNGTVIKKIKEVFGIVLPTKVSIVHELTFQIPTKIERNHIPVDNPNIDLIKHNYLIKVVLGNVEEYFILNNIDKTGDESDEFVMYHSYGLGYELNSKALRGYSATSKTLRDILEEVLEPTAWTVGYVDSEFDSMYRSIEVGSETVYSLIGQLTEIFNSVATWDTKNRRVNMVMPSNLGVNKGLKITDEKYLMSLNEVQDSENIVTRLSMYGRNNIGIQRLNPTGSNYIEDYSYYIYPFERDENRNVIQRSYYMSDELCHALLDYTDKVESRKGEFGGYLDSLNHLNSEMLEREKELDDIETELRIILDSLDVENTLGVPDPTLHSQIVSERQAKEFEKRSKQQEIIAVEEQRGNVRSLMQQLQSELSVENNFTYELAKEWSLYIREREYVNDAIINDEDLLEEGIKAFEYMREPAIEITVDIVNFLEIIEAQRDWDKLVLGDIIVIRHKRLGIDIKAKITEINYDFDNSSIDVVLSNAQRNSNDNSLMNMIDKAYGTSTQVAINRYDWDLSKENNGAINDIINNMWDATKQAVEAGYEQMIEISERGIIIRSPEDPDTYLVIQNGMLAITADNGNTWKHAITSEGIVAERLFGKAILGVNLAIEDESGIMMWRGSRGQIFDRNGNEVMRMGLVTDPPEPEEFGMTSWNSVTKVAITDKEGMSISRRVLGDNEWERVLWAHPTNGTLYARDLVAERLKIVGNLGEEILNAETGDFDLGWFERITADGKLTTTEKYELWAEVNTIMSGYQILMNHAQTFRFAGTDNTYDYNAQNPESTKQSSNNVLVNTNQLSIYYSALINFIQNYISIPPAFDNAVMERTDDINRTSLIFHFRNYYDEAERVKNAIENYLIYSGLQLGTFYNNLIIDQQAGFMAIRSDMKYRARMSATDGLALEKWEDNGWVKKLYAAIGDPDWEDGTLVAEGLVTKNLRIVDGELGEKIIFDQNDGVTINGNNGEQIRLNANEAISIDVNGDPRFWVGTDGQLYAKNIIITPDDPDMLVELPDGSFISDLTVNSLRSLNSLDLQNYVYIKDDFIKFFTGNNHEDDPHKLLITLTDIYEEHNGYPIMEWGAGYQHDRTLERGTIYKDAERFAFEYKDNLSNMSWLHFNDAGYPDAIQLKSGKRPIRLEAPDGIFLKGGSASIEITNSGVKINGQRIDLN